MVEDRPTAVYRIYDADDQLLYVGMAVDPEHRIDSHLDKKLWGASATSQSITWYPNRAEAAFAEDQAIKAERPLHNIAGTLAYGEHLSLQRRATAGGNVVGSRHRDRAEATRVPHEIAEAARQALEPHRRTVHAFLGACLNALSADPAAMLAAVEGYWPEPKRRGRPRKGPAPRKLASKPPVNLPGQS